MPGSNGWDYNCNGVDDFEYTVSVDCGALTSCDMSTQKWMSGSPPDCGVTAQVGTCAGITFFNCYSASDGDRTQGCH
jgi:hypothetical protein